MPFEWRLTRRLVLANLLEELGDEGRPPGLVRRSKSGARIAMKILVKEEQIAEMRVALELLDGTVKGTASVRIRSENGDQPARKVARDLPERGEFAGTRREFDAIPIAEKEVEVLQRFDQ